jgi:hypothetical protein
MATLERFRQLALSFPEAEEATHFDKTSFRAGKKIFTTLDVESRVACVRLSEIDQDVFSSYDRSICWPVPNKWGKLGWTYLNLKKIRKDMLMDALRLSYVNTAPARLAKLLKDDRS